MFIIWILFWRSVMFSINAVLSWSKFDSEIAYTKQFTLTPFKKVVTSRLINFFLFCVYVCKCRPPLHNRGVHYIKRIKRTCQIFSKYGMLFIIPYDNRPIKLSLERSLCITNGLAISTIHISDRKLKRTTVVRLLNILNTSGIHSWRATFKLCRTKAIFPS